MKKLFYIFSAFVALAFVSCQKPQEPETPKQEENVPVIHYVFNIKVDNPDGADTKAVKTGWENGDVIGLWIDGNNQNDSPALTLTYNGQSWDCEQIQTSVTLGVTGCLSALYKSDNDFEDVTGSIPLVLSRENVPYTTEKLDDGSVEVTATLSGWLYETPIQIVVPGIEEDFENYSLSCEDLATGDGISIEIIDEEFAVFAIKDEEPGCAAYGFSNTDGAAFYFTSSSTSSEKPFTFNLSYNNKLYTYTSKSTTIYADGLSVKRVNKKLPAFAIDEDGNPEEGCKWTLVGGDTPSVYVKVTSQPEDWSGEYLLVYESSSTEGRCWTGIDAASCYVDATIVNGVISSKPSNAVTVTIASMNDGYSIKVNGSDKDGNYISGKSGNNTIVYGTTAVANEITLTNGLVTILSNSTSFRYNAASGNDRFRYYKTTTTGSSYICPALYKLVDEPAPTKTLTSIAVSGTPSKTTYFVGESFDSAGLTVTGTYDDSSTEVFTEGITWNVTPETLTTETTSVSVTATVGGVSSNAFNVDITVNAIPEKTIEEFITSEGGKCYLTGTVSNIANMTYGNFDLTDESGTIYIYGCLTSTGEAKKFGTLGVIAGDKIKVLAEEYEYYQSSTHEAKNVIFVEEIEIPKTKSVMTIATPSNGTITVKNGTTEVNSGSEIEEGTELTIDAAPAENYKLVSISVIDADNTDVQVTNSKFTMPDKAVTVSATFEPSSSNTYVLCTSTDDLVAGAKYIIVNGISGDVNCVSNVSNSNNRKVVGATVSNSSIEVADNSTIMTFTLGGSTDAWTLHTDNYAGTNGYLASASSGSNNYCRVISDETTCKISFSSNAAVITIQPHTSRNILRYNSSSSIFACYSSGQDAVYLYKKN